MKQRKSRASARKPARKSGTSTQIGGVARQVVSATAWRKARAAMTAREKKHMRAMDAIAAARVADDHDAHPLLGRFGDVVGQKIGRDHEEDGHDGEDQCVADRAVPEDMHDAQTHICL